MKPLVLGLGLVAACTYDGSVGRTYPPVGPGHLELRWAIPIGGLEGNYGRRVEIGESGAVVIAGRGVGDTDFLAGPAMLPPEMSTEQVGLPTTAFVAVRSGVDGSHRWGAMIAVPSGVQDPMSEIEDVAIDGDDNVYVTGIRSGEGVPRAVFVARYSDAGVLEWERGLGPGSDGRPTALALTPDGEVIVSGGYTGTIDIDGAAFTSVDAHDAFLIAYASDGSVRWAQSFHGPGETFVTDVVVTDGGDLVVTGSTGPGGVFGGAALDAGSGDYQTVLARFDADGDHLWSQNLEPSWWEHRLELDGAGQLIASGTRRDAPGLGVRYVDRLGVTFHAVEIAGPRAPAAVAPNGMLLTAANLDELVPAIDLGAGDVAGDAGDAFIAGFDGDGAVLGGSLFGSEHLAPGWSYGIHLTDVDTTREGIVATGELTWGVSFGGDMLWPHGSGPIEPGRIWVTNGADAVVAMFDWVAD